MGDWAVSTGSGAAASVRGTSAGRSTCGVGLGVAGTSGIASARTACRAIRTSTRSLGVLEGSSNSWRWSTLTGVSLRCCGAMLGLGIATDCAAWGLGSGSGIGLLGLGRSFHSWRLTCAPAAESARRGAVNSIRRATAGLGCCRCGLSDSSTGFCSGGAGGFSTSRLTASGSFGLGASRSIGSSKLCVASGFSICVQ